MKKGFTLIELLAVIVILAIIAIIAVPIIITIISDSTTSTTVRSGEFYINAVEIAIMNKNVDEGGSFNPTECIIKEDGNVTCGNVTLNVEVDGEKPVAGFLKYSEGNLIEAEMKFQNDTIVMNNAGTLSNLEDDIVCARVTEETQTTGNIPNGKFLQGDEYICEVKDDVKYHFFVLSTEGDNVNLILDRNINSDGTLAEKYVTEAETTNGIYSRTPWISAQDYSDNNVNNLSCKYEACANLPPITALNFLNNATKDWKNVGNLNDKYMDEGNRYGKIELVGKARLPKIIELENAGCREGEDNLGSCPLWLFNTINGGSHSYWALTSGKAGSAWTVSSDNRLRTIAVYLNVGIRPVISVPKSDIY